MSKLSVETRSRSRVAIGDGGMWRIMRHRGVVELEGTVPHPTHRQDAAAAGPGAAAGVLLGLQRSAGNAAVAGRLAPPGRTVDVTASPIAFVQRCGPTPCDCSAEERADYAEQHPDEPAAPEADASAAQHEHLG